MLAGGVFGLETDGEYDDRVVKSDFSEPCDD